MANSPGVVIEDQDLSVFAQNFGQAISAHRHWNRQLVK
jgi:hypothetical protein